MQSSIAFVLVIQSSIACTLPPTQSSSLDMNFHVPMPLLMFHINKIGVQQITT